MLGEADPYGYPVLMDTPLTPPFPGRSPATDDGVVFTAAAIARGVGDGTLDPLAVVDGCLRRIAERDDSIRAFSALRADEARAEAVALRTDPGSRQRPLAGVPVAIKDIIDVEGLPTLLGSGAVRPRPATADAEVVRRLRAAGAIVIGKTTLPELGIWGTTDGPAGVTRNPRHPKRTAGGSSGGSAAAVAAGMVPLALGTDGLGSIRIPGAACGIPGFRPGTGVVPDSLRGGDWHGMATIGPLASTVSDVALATAVLAGREPLAGADVDRPLLIAISTRPPVAGLAVDARWAGAVLELGDRLRGAGHNVVEDHPRYSALYAIPVFSRWVGGVAQVVAALGDDLDWTALQRRSRAHIRLGRLVHRLDGPGTGLRDRWLRDVDSFFGGYDALVTPALARPPIRARRWSRATWLGNVHSNARYAPFGALWNLAGAPAGVVPIARHPGGTPIAAQVVAAPGNDERVLAVMRAVERLVEERVAAGA